MKSPHTIAILSLALVLPSAADVPLIPRETLFGNPERAGVQISPDGTRISYLAPLDGVMNVWVMPVDGGEAVAITKSTERPIRSYGWAWNNDQILYSQDKAGDENFLLYGIDVQSGAERTLTPFEKTRVQVVSVSPLIKDRILVGLNNRDPQWHDIHSLDIKTGKLTEILRADGYAGFVADANHALRLALRPNAAGGMFLQHVSHLAASWQWKAVHLHNRKRCSPPQL